MLVYFYVYMAGECAVMPAQYFSSVAHNGFI